MSDDAKRNADDPPPSATDRSLAVARKLSSGRPALGRNNTTGGGALGRNVTGANPPVTESSGKHKAEPPPESDPNSVREAVLAKRRASVHPTGGLSAPGADRPPSKAPPPPKSRHLPKRLTHVLGASLVLLALVVAAYFAKQWQFDNSDRGRVRNQLIAWEFGPRDPAAREATFAELDKLGTLALTQSVDLLADPDTAQRGDSRSTRLVREIANTYLLRRAVQLKIDPPASAKDIVTAYLEGRPPTAAQWQTAQDAWRAWVNDVIARGLVPKA